MLTLQQLVVAAALIASVQATPDSRRTIKFKPPFKAMDPEHHKSIYNSFRTCSAACVKTETYAQYGDSAWDAFGTLGTYTACVSNCLATELLNAVNFYKASYGKIYDVGVNHLRLTKEYIAGKSDFDLIGNRTRVDYSCVLPNEYFVPWDKITVQTNAFYLKRGSSINSPQSNDYNRGIPVHVRADCYLNYCSQLTDGDKDAADLNYVDDANGLGGLKLQCDDNLYQYLASLQRNLGHQVLHPDHCDKVPNGACNDRVDCHVNLKPNPRGQCFDKSVCVVEKTRITGADGKSIDSDDRFSYLTELVVTEPDADGKCKDVTLNFAGDFFSHLTLKMKKIHGSDLGLYKVSGLPKAVNNQCTLTGTLGLPEDANPFTYTPADVGCAEYVHWTNFRDDKGNKYQHGNVEYINAKNYANHLTKQLFDYTQCPYYDEQLNQDKTITDVYDHEDTYGNGYSIACLYRTVTWKCDCMKAVINCYENESRFTSVLGKTLGRAASILCGLVLCQKPVVYRMFADADGLRHTLIMKEILLQSGADAVADNMSMASMAFLGFGLGMVAFVVTKQAVDARKKSTLEDGYRNLI